MVQEVQQQGNRYQTPELIPGVGISERKIKEHTQVTPTHTYYCKGSAGSVGGTVGGGTPDLEKYGTFTINSQSGNVRFSVVNGAIRIPLAGIYQITWTASGGLTGISAKANLVTSDGTTLDTLTLNGGAKSNTVIVSFGKYELLQYKMTAHYGGADGNAIYASITSIMIQKL